MIKRNLSLLVFILSFLLLLGCLKNRSTTSSIIEKAGETCTYIYPVYTDDTSKNLLRYCFTSCKPCPDKLSSNEDIQEKFCPLKENNTKYLENPPDMFQNYVGKTITSEEIYFTESSQILDIYEEITSIKLRESLENTDILNKCKRSVKTSSDKGFIIKDDIISKYGVIEYSDGIAIVSLNSNQPRLIWKLVTLTQRRLEYSEASKYQKDGWSLPTEKECQQKEPLQALYKAFSKKNMEDKASSTLIQSIEGYTGRVTNRFWLQDSYRDDTHYTCNISGESSWTKDNIPLENGILILRKEYEESLGQITPLTDYKNNAKK